MFFDVPLHRQSDKQAKIEVMKRRIIYVGTLIDLAAICEPETEAERIEVRNIIKIESYE